MFILLFGFWIVLNGRISLELTIMGLGFTVVLFLLAWLFWNYDLERDIRVLRKIPVAVRYLGQLILEMAVSTMKVLRFVYSAKYEPEPQLVEFDASFASNLGRTLMANYITLTPGTITVDVEKDHFTVHCLDADFAPDPEGIMVDIIRRLEAK